VGGSSADSQGGFARWSTAGPNSPDQWTRQEHHDPHPQDRRRRRPPRIRRRRRNRARVLDTGSASAATQQASVTDHGTAAAGDTGTAADTESENDDSSTGPHAANGITEEELTGDTASKVEAAVLAENPDATIDRMGTEADGGVYEGHITLADGTRATVTLDESFAITATETGDAGGHGGGGGGPHSANGITGQELTGDTASKVEAAVLAANPDATIDRMETDADGGVYEAHITLADGTHATVTLDESFAVTATETQD
jgi:hypothetical protein